ncbi:MAG: assembly protein [Inoviridae sp.]|nr:MAG: assembly protein [Inoviridae sp.]
MMWDVYLIIQDISMLDKQARKALAEHVVYCRRTDRMNIPIIGSIFKLLTGGNRMPVPKWHIAIVKYGDQQHSLQVDSWWYNGTELYNSYDTSQIFSTDYNLGSFCYVPPYILYSKTRVKKWDVKNVMRLTHIYLRKYSLITIAGAGISLGSLLTYLFAPNATTVIHEPITSTIPQKKEEPLFQTPNLNLNQFTSSTPETPAKLIYIKSSWSINTGEQEYHQQKYSDGTNEYTAHQLSQKNIKIEPIGHCRALLEKEGLRTVISCT